MSTEVNIGIPLHLAVGVDRDARVLITILDENPEGKATLAIARGFDDRKPAYSAVFGGRVLDVAVVGVDGVPKPVKWWRVRGWAHSERMDTVPIYYDGPVDSVPDSLVRLSEAQGKTVMLRPAAGGPWRTLNGGLEAGLLFKDTETAREKEEINGTDHRIEESGSGPEGVQPGGGAPGPQEGPPTGGSGDPG